MGDTVRIALVGATGMVGRTALNVFAERSRFPVSLSCFATDRSTRKPIPFGDDVLQVQSLPDLPPEVDFALFAAPGDVARKLVPEWAEAGIRIVDNSSMFRLTEGVPLVVPEVNANEIPRDGLIVANPNCSTIQLAVAMAPLDKAFVLEDIHVATYQSVSGAGAEAVERWQLEVDGGIGGRSPFTAPIHGNVIPAIGEEDPNCYYTEELKLINELPKILGRDLSISATAVRVPVAVGHSEAVQVQLAREASTSELVEVLQKAPGIHLRSRCDIPLTPREIEGTDVVYVSRVRPHPSRRDTFLLWIVADNLRKGAATNAIQVIEHWHENLQGGSAG